MIVVTQAGRFLPAGLAPDEVKGMQVSSLQDVTAAVESFNDIEEAALNGLLERIDDARVVFIGEASHGTSEFFRMRQHITRALIEQKGFTIISAEADWPDAERVDEYVRHRPGGPAKAWQAFTRFPLWMWRNHEVLGFIEWLRTYNEGKSPEQRVGFYGLDLYSLHTSLHEVVRFLEQRDSDLADMARQRYACLEPFSPEPEQYGRAVALHGYEMCEDEVVSMLGDLLKHRLEPGDHLSERFFDAEQNARVVAGAERYYRLVYEGRSESWNQRDRHMFEMLQALLEYRGPEARAVVWAHNSHIGNASATQAVRYDQINIGQLARETFGRDAYLIGFGMHTGTVAAASDWGGEVHIKKVRPSLPNSLERLCHDTGLNRFMLPLRESVRPEIRDLFRSRMLERFIGVIYRPETERQSHYQHVVPAEEYDEYIWFDTTRAVEPLGRDRAPELPEGHPFRLID